MQDILKPFIDLGFTPLNCVLAMGLITIWRMSITKDKKQTEDREAWHAETRAEVNVLKGHVDECDDDRERLRIDHTLLKERFDRVSRCPRKDCPMRLP